MPRIFYFVVVVVFCMLPDFANAQAKPKRDISNDRSVSVARSAPKKNVTNQTARKNSVARSAPKKNVTNQTARKNSTARSAPKKNVTNQTARKNSTMHSSVQEAYAVMSVDGTILTFYCDSNKIARKGVVYGLNQEYDLPGWCEVNDSKDIIPSKVKIVIFDNSFKAAHPISCFCWFAGFEKLIKIVGLENLNTSNVTDMVGMFYGCSSLTSLDVRDFNTSSVSNMSHMFSGCSSLTSLDVRGFNTSNVTDMSGMFCGCFNLTSLDVRGFNTSNVTDMRGMFLGCSSLKSLDVRGFNTSKLANVESMFANCGNLKVVYVGNGWNIKSIKGHESIFKGSQNAGFVRR